jgi:hypothetical protein
VSGPGPLGYLLAAVMIVTAGYCMTRLAAARLRRRPTVPDLDISHVVMGVAMAGLLVPRLSVLPDGAWEAVFGVALGWFGWRFIRASLIRAHRGHVHGDAAPGAHHAAHVLASGAMLYMFIAVSPALAAPAGPPGAGTAVAETAAARSAVARTAVAGTVMGGQSAGTIRFPVLALALALALFGYVVWITDRMSSLPPVSTLRLAAGDAVVGTGSSPAPGGPGQARRSGDASRSGVASPSGVASLSGDTPRSEDASRSGDAPLSRPAPLSPRLAACCEIVMSITMGYMLIMML